MTDKDLQPDDAERLLAVRQQFGDELRRGIRETASSRPRRRYLRLGPILASLLVAVGGVGLAVAASDGGDDSERAADEAKANALTHDAGLLAKDALICREFGPEAAAHVDWCAEALDAAKNRDDVASLVNGGTFKVTREGDTVTVTGPNGDETVSTFQP